MSELYQSLSHSKWDCKYHVVFVPKRRRKGSVASMERSAWYRSNLRREQNQAVNYRIIAAIVGNEGDLIMEGARCNPGVGRLDRTSFSLRGVRNLGPFATQFAADRQHGIPGQVLG